MKTEIRLIKIINPLLLALSLTMGLLLSLSMVAQQPAQAAPPYPNQQDAATAAIKWMIETQQNDDGGYNNFGGPSNVGSTADAILAIASAGFNPAAPYPGKSNTPLDWMQTHPISMANYAATNGGTTGKLILSLSAAHQNPRDFMGYNLLISLTNHYSGGQYAPDPFNQSLALLALNALSEPIPMQAVTWLKSEQQPSGAWQSFGFDSLDSTAFAIMAFRAANLPVDDPAIISATTYLRNQQADSGAWDAFGNPSPNSTALVIQALASLNADFYSAEGAWAKNGQSPLTALLELQSESGAFQINDFLSGELVDNLFATMQAIPGVTGRPLPLPSHSEAVRRGLSCLAASQTERAGWAEFGTGEASAGGTARAIAAMVAAGEDPTAARWVKNGSTPMDALENMLPTYLESARGGRIGKVMQAVAGAGLPYTVTNFAGYNLVSSMTNAYNPQDGSYASTAFGPFAQAEAILGLQAAGYPVEREAIIWVFDWLAENALNNENNPDETSISLNTLGRLGIRAENGIAHLRQIQQADGSWTTFNNINTSAEAGQGLLANEQNPFGPAWSKVVSGTLRNIGDLLLHEQGADGCWQSGPQNDNFATTDALIVLSQQPSWPNGSIVVSKTVGMESSCALSSTLMAVPGSSVTYCYQVQNSGPYTLTLHTAMDDPLGTVLGPDFELTLAPGQSTQLTKTVSITETPQRNLLYWWASNPAITGVHAVDGTVARVESERLYLPLMMR